MRRLGMWLVVAVTLLMAACGIKPVEAVVVDTPRSGWSEPAELTYTNADTLSLLRISPVVRMESGRVAEPLKLSVRCTAPSGAHFESLVVVGAEGRHSGGSFTELRGEWVDGVRLGERGDYTFTLRPTEEITGVWSVGVDIVANKK